MCGLAMVFPVELTLIKLCVYLFYPNLFWIRFLCRSIIKLCYTILLLIGNGVNYSTAYIPKDEGETQPLLLSGSAVVLPTVQYVQSRCRYPVKSSISLWIKLIMEAGKNQKSLAGLLPFYFIRTHGSICT
jgi:hypothetical protein